MPMRTRTRPRRLPLNTGTRKGSGRTRCGATRRTGRPPAPRGRPRAERLAHELEVPQLQVAQAAVDELGGLRRGAGGEVALLEERDGDAAQGEVARDARAGHTAPDHDHVERCLVDAREAALDHDVLTTEYLGRIVSRGRERGGGFAGRRAA